MKNQTYYVIRGYFLMVIFILSSSNIQAQVIGEYEDGDYTLSGPVYNIFNGQPYVYYINQQENIGAQIEWEVEHGSIAEASGNDEYIEQYSNEEAYITVTWDQGYTSHSIRAYIFDASGGYRVGFNVTTLDPGTLNDENYIHTITPRVPTTDVELELLSENQKIENVTYFDGLGRPLQNVVIRSGGNGEDIITHMEYDNLGRQDKSYLPYASNSNNSGSYRANALVETNNFYNTIKYENTLNPYSEKHYEASPLNRVLEQGAPGSDWVLGQGHEIKFGYDSNSGTEVKFKVSLTFSNNTYTPSLSSNGYYAAGELYKSVVKDENWTSGNNHTTEEFKDKHGRVLLKRTYNASVAHDTYYVYDDYGNLTYVLPPKMDASTTSLATVISQLDDLGYQYKYDHKNRLVEKKIPGKGLEYIVYNNLDQPILTQDAIQKTSGEWLFTKYDAFGRVAYTGKATSLNTTTREAVQTEVNSITGNLWVTQCANSTNYGGVSIFYNNGAYPNNSTSPSLLVTLSEILTTNYYDTYVDRPTGAPTSVTLMESSPSETNETNVKGLATVSKVKVLDVTGTNVWINTLTYYDTKSRPIYAYSENTYLGTVDIVETKLDFVGKPTKSKTTHTRNGITIATIDNFTYDHTGRLLTQTQCIGDQTMGYNCPGSNATIIDLALTGNITTDQVASNSIIITNGTIVPNTRLWISPELQEVIANNTYDELGQLISKGVGGNILNTNRLQTVNYTYNIRGWLKQINDPASLGNDLFGFKINYNTNNHGGTNLFNGNISEIEWKTANTDNNLKWYTYNYDALNRIVSGIDNTGHYNLGSLTNPVTYDKNGNITTLKRNGHTNSSGTTFGVMDDLTYTYDSGNKLTDILEQGHYSLGFKNNGHTQTGDYTYDANGNMTRDDNKEILSITYNHLNLPKKIVEDDGTLKYLYDATGLKQTKIFTPTDEDSVITEYVGNYIYKEDKLKFFNHPEGYIEPKNELDLSQGFNYIYQYKDHLGNVRLSYSDTDGNGSITASTEILEENNYYPFGLRHKGYNNNPVTNHPHKYQGVEFNESLGLNLYEMNLRQYDPAIGRWTGIDPLTHHSQSTYTGMDNNPVFWADPSGAAVEQIAGGYRYTGEHAKLAFGALQKQYGGSGLEPGTVILPEITITGSKTSAILGAMRTAHAIRSTQYYSFENQNTDGNGNLLAGFEAPEKSFLDRFFNGPFYEYNGRNYAVDSEGKTTGTTVVQGHVDEYGLFGPGKLAKTANLWKVGAYKNLRKLKSGYDAHHVGQKAHMMKFIPAYNKQTAPSILVPKEGHTIVGQTGRVTTSMKGVENARQLLGRDILELRRVYPTIPNSSLKKLIKMNKQMYPNAFKK